MSDNQEHGEEKTALDLVVCELRPFDGIAGSCARCGSELTGRRARWCSQACYNADFIEHHYPSSRKIALRRDNHACVKCGAAPGVGDLETNHVVPRVGQGYNVGCWNHSSNLETLCKPCHRATTKEQMRERRVAAQAEIFEAQRLVPVSDSLEETQ